MKTLTRITTFYVTLAILVWGTAALAASRSIILATTSTQDSGLVVMDSGTVVQEGKPKDVIAVTVNAFVAAFRRISCTALSEKKIGTSLHPQLHPPRRRPFPLRRQHPQGWKLHLLRGRADAVGHVDYRRRQRVHRLRVFEHRG